MTVSKIRVTAATLQSRVHETAASSSNLVFIPPPNKKSMAGMMTFLQVKACLEAGKIVGRPVLDEHGNWTFVMERFAANRGYRVDVVAECSGSRVTRLVALL